MGIAGGLWRVETGAGSKSSLRADHKDSVKGAEVSRRVCAGRANDDETTGLSAPASVAIPIAPLQPWASYSVSASASAARRAFLSSPSKFTSPWK
jgi:hypothetical protein